MSNRDYLDDELETDDGDVEGADVYVERLLKGHFDREAPSMDEETQIERQLRIEFENMNKDYNDG